MSSTRAPRVGTHGTVRPLGLFDLCDDRVMAHKDHRVVVIQPHGCPRNGTMGHMYVDCVTCEGDTGHDVFVGLILISSFVKEGTK